MRTIALPSGTYAVDDILNGFEIMEKPSSNVDFTAINIFENQLYVQFKNSSGYMYSEVDVNTLKEAETCESIGKFISSQVVKKFDNEKLPNALIIKDEYINDPVLIVSGDILNFPKKTKPGILIVPSDAKVEYIHPDDATDALTVFLDDLSLNEEASIKHLDQEPEF